MAEIDYSDSWSVVQSYIDKDIFLKTLVVDRRIANDDGFLHFYLTENEMVVENLSVYETVKIIISTSLFTGLLVSTPVLTLLLNRIVKEKKDVRKYIYTLILLIAIIATPKPSMIINLIFLLSLTIFAEITLFITRRINGN